LAKNFKGSPPIEWIPLALIHHLPTNPRKKKGGSCLKRGGAVTLENNKMVTVVYMKDTFFLPDNLSPPA
jgi:hypothetical protein